jgi:uncharacterized sporulation protein YeaH/YhbH (DUF444 family)
MAKKKTYPRKTARDVTAQDIFDLWVDSAKSGLGIGKKYASDIFDEYEPRLLESIQAMLDDGETFDNDAKKATKQVAKDTGKICRMFTLGKTVSKDTFDFVFLFVRENHPICPAGGGSGGWCEI